MFIIFICLLSYVSSRENGTSRGRLLDLNRNFVYNNTYEYDVIYTVPVNSTTQQIMDFVEKDNNWTRFPSRAYIECTGVDPQLPLFVTATQQRGVVSWELPQPSSEDGTCTMARTLCPRDADSLDAFQTRPTLQLSSYSARNISVRVKLRRVGDFFIEVDKEVNMSVTPTTPKYYYFSFDNNPWNWTVHSASVPGTFPTFNYTIPKSVILMIESDDELCAVVSIQNDSCPVLDEEQEVRHQGYHFTMTRRGGITLTQSMFSHGFYVVLIVKQDDADCQPTAQPEIVRATPRNKTFTLKVIATISYQEYLIAALLSLALVVVFFIIVVLLTYCTCQCTEQAILAEEIISPNRSLTSGEAGPSTEPAEETDSRRGSSSSSESLKRVAGVSVAQLSRGGSRLGSRSMRYLWWLLTVAVIYALPVVQLLGTYQNMVFQTGDQDLCYYNFLCAHPLGRLSDFNHVFSNAGYVLLGLLFVAQVATRQRRYRRLSPHLKSVGIPPHFGLLLGLGFALAAEGALSACYHLCPNHMNFQFDSSFMYVTAVLGMVKLYQSRHPDVNARAHHTFTLVAVVFALGLVGTLWPGVPFWVGFTALHLLACLLLTINIYYMSTFKLERGMCARAWRLVRSEPRRLAPRYRARAVLLAIANLANWALALYGVVEHNKDFARHLLAILVGNTILYTLFYVCMKLVHREKIYFHTWLYFLGALAAWFGALYLYLHSKTKWSESPARSRVRNAPCSLLRFYDSHDLWHLSSAAAMFLCFNLLLTVDDGLHLTARGLIPVF